MEEEHEDHGHSVAAWTLVIIVLVGAVIGGIAVLVANGVLGIIAAVVVVIGVIAGKVLSMAGYGNKNRLMPPAPPAGTSRESGSTTSRQS
ncbi:HGxxPAAW family protein [Intrasporangium sp.]|uniref:HGxxPAAW family protein n=1 Tax=Intrasporangium sp. TaxID=1925024 RepID=UPI003221993A